MTWVVLFATTGCYPMDYKFVTTKQLIGAIGASRWTINQRVRDGEWKLGIHVFHENRSRTLYNLPLIVDWLVNKGDPQAHQRAIDNFLTSLPSNQKQARITNGVKTTHVIR